MSKILAGILLVLTLVAVLTAGAAQDEDLEELSGLAGKKRIATLRREMKEMKRDIAWYSLHVAAAAACRGATETGGSGIHGNIVLPKENTKSCADQCASTEFTICDADVAIHGTFGKAESYTKNIGQFYNYGCTRPGNTNPLFDEVKAGQDGLFNFDVSGGYSRYYRFCCCRFS